MHVPLTQLVPGAHAFPHPPQFLGSVSTSTHTPLQALLSGPQAQCAPTQIAPAVHCLPHAPQLLGSTAVSTHAPPHTVWLPGHWQLPDAQN